MALDANTLKSLMIAQLQAQGFDTVEAHAWTEKFCTAISTAIVTHIQTAGKATGTDAPSGDTHNLSIT